MTPADLRTPSEPERPPLTDAELVDAARKLNRMIADFDALPPLAAEGTVPELVRSSTRKSARQPPPSWSAARRVGLRAYRKTGRNGPTGIEFQSARITKRHEVTSACVSCRAADCKAGTRLRR